MIHELPNSAITLVVSYIGALPREERYVTDRKDLLNVFLTSKRIKTDLCVDRDWWIYNLLYSSFRKSLMFARERDPSHQEIKREICKFSRKKGIIGVEELCRC